MPVYTGTDQTSAPLLLMLEDKIASYKTLDSRLASAKGDKESAVTNFMEQSDNAKAVQLRKAIETATKQLRELAEKSVKTEQLSDEETAKLETEMKTIGDEIREGRKAITMISQSLGSDPDGVKAALDTLGDPTKSGRGRKPGEAGSTLPRLSAYVNVKGGKLNQSYNAISAVALATGAEAESIQKALADSAGVAYPGEFKEAFTKSGKSEIKFKFEGADGTKYAAIATPKERQKPGRKPVAAEKAEETDAA